jgi:hypothetical protein
MPAGRTRPPNTRVATWVGAGFFLLIGATIWWIYNIGFTERAEDDNCAVSANNNHIAITNKDNYTWHGIAISLNDDAWMGSSDNLIQPGETITISLDQCHSPLDKNDHPNVAPSKVEVCVGDGQDHKGVYIENLK